MDGDKIYLEGRRTRLIIMTPNHAEALHSAAQAPEIWSGSYAKPLDTLTEVNHYIDFALKEQANGTCIPLVIWDKLQGKIVGSTRFFDLSTVHRSVEIGHTWLHPSVWRTQINTECKYALLSEAFEQLAMLRVQIKTDSRNHRSQAAIERLGAVKEGILRHHRVLYDGYVRDTAMYSITNLEWPAVKERLSIMMSVRL